MSDLIKRAREVGFHRAALEAGATITGGPIRDFAGGWGHACFLGGRKLIAHHWQVLPKTEDVPEYTPVRSACGVVHGFTDRVPMLGQGNLPFCVRCENSLMRKARKT